MHYQYTTEYFRLQDDLLLNFPFFKKFQFPYCIFRPFLLDYGQLNISG